MESFAATQRKACELARIPHSTFRYRADDEKDNQLRMKLTELAHEQPRYGYRRLEVLLRREGEAVNHKRIFRIYQTAGLSVKAQEAQTSGACRTTALRGQCAQSAMGHRFRS